MRIPKRTIVVTLEDPAGNAVLTFSRLRENVQQRIMAELKKAKEAGDNYSSYAAMAEYHKAILGSCLSVEGLEHEDGTVVSVQDVQQLNLYRDTILLIVGAYFAAADKVGGEAEAKNEQTQQG